MAYVSPEQIAGNAVDARSDLFSVGLVLAEMLEGKRLFQRSEDRLSANDRSQCSNRLVRSRIAPAIRLILRRALHRDPNERDQSAAGFARAIRATASAVGLRVDRGAMLDWVAGSQRGAASGTLPTARFGEKVAASMLEEGRGAMIPSGPRPTLPSRSGRDQLSRGRSCRSGFLSVSPSSTVAAADSEMAQRGYHYAVVVSKGALTGVVCRCDAERASPFDEVGSMMTPRPVCGLVVWSPAEALRVMKECGVGFLPLLGDGQALRGVVTLSDFAATGLLREANGVDLCASCDSRHGLALVEHQGVRFCKSRLSQGHRDDSSDESYFTLGGSG